MDLLMTYGWVVVMGIIVVILLMNMNFLNFAGCDNTKVGFSQVVPVDWEINPKDNTIVKQVENWAGESVEITDYNATMGDVSCVKNSVGADIEPGDDATLTVDCNGGAKISDRLFSGTCYSALVNIAYKYPDGETFNSAGSVKGKTQE